MGGGLGVRFRPDHEPLDLPRWAGIMARHLGPLGVTVATEPGDFIAKQTRVHLAKVVTVEDRDGTTFVGLDTGWNVLCEHFVYDIPFFPTVHPTRDGLLREGGSERSMFRSHSAASRSAPETHSSAKTAS